MADKCKGCGTPNFPRGFEGLPCVDYCCACCPRKNDSPCPKEAKFGTVAELWSKPREPIDFKAIAAAMRGGKQ